MSEQCIDAKSFQIARSFRISNITHEVSMHIVRLSCTIVRNYLTSSMMDSYARLLP